MKYGLEEVADALRSRVLVRLGEKIAPVRVKRSVEGPGRPERFRLALEELGPTFIKFGQLLSTRPAVIPIEYVQELGRLQDHVKPEPPEKIRAEVEQQLHGRIEEVFLQFDAEPLAAGSIAQVHRATTREGDSVVVKVRRPGIVQIIQAECEMLEDLAGILKLTLFQHETIDPMQMVREFAEAVFKETDLANERRNLLRFIRNFADDPTVHVPRVYVKYCTASVLTMEYIDGIRPGDPAFLREHGAHPKRVARRGAEFVLKQIFELGFFHTDPHPGTSSSCPATCWLRSISDRSPACPPWTGSCSTKSCGYRGKRARARRASPGSPGHGPRDDRHGQAGRGHGATHRDLPRPAGAEHPLRHRGDADLRSVPLELRSAALAIHAHAQDHGHDRDVRPFARSGIQSDRGLDALCPAGEPAGVRAQAIAASHAPGGAGRRGTGVEAAEDVNVILSKFRQGKFQVRVQHEHLETLNKTLDKSSNRISFALIIAALLIGSSMLVAQENLQQVGMFGYFIAAVFGVWLLISIIRGGKL
jgi:ubiquinone biosynthesis protein